jgi:hypothetical protein
MAAKRGKATTPLGLMVIGGFTQGSSFVATLGFGTESLWDSDPVYPKGIMPNPQRMELAGAQRSVNSIQC